MVRVTSVPDSVFTGAVRFTVPLALPPELRDKLDGKSMSNLWSLVAWTVTIPAVPLITTEKGTISGTPGCKTLPESS